MIDGTTRTDLDDEDTQRVIDLIDDAIDAGVNSPGAHPIAPHCERSGVAGIIRQRASDDSNVTLDVEGKRRELEPGCCRVFDAV